MEGKKLNFMAQGVTKVLKAKTELLKVPTNILICFKFSTVISIVSKPFIVKNENDNKYME